MNPTTKPRILYIEDTQTALLLVSRLLAEDFTVIEAESPLTGIELAKVTQPDLVLLDINLPGMSGLEVATRLRALFPNTPLVALTAETSPQARERAIAAGCDGYLTKPIDPDALPDQLRAYLAGQHDTIPNLEEHRQAHVARLVERLEQTVRELTKQDEQNMYLLDQNQHMISALHRRQRLLEAGARTAHSAAGILDLGALLTTAVETICQEFGFDYAGFFLLNTAGDQAVLQAGHGVAGAAMLAEGYQLAVSEKSMIGRAIQARRAIVTRDVVATEPHLKNPHLPNTRSEMALPLIAGEQVLGGLTVQSEQPNAFSDDDITALQLMADQLAIAIRNAKLLQDLDKAHNELIRTKTFEAIATATGEAVHWVGNKAAPIPGSVARVRTDLAQLLAIATALQSPAAPPAFATLWQQVLDASIEHGLNLPAITAKLAAMHPLQLERLDLLPSVLEDLEIIAQSANTILDIKEDLIGPARLQHLAPTDLGELLADALRGMAFPAGVADLQVAPELPPVYIDERQMSRVFINLFKNAWEAMQGAQASPKLWITVTRDSDPRFVLTQVRDNGPGIPAEVLDKIWVTFFTTKGQQGGTGLGLNASMAIINQTGGKIWAESQIGQGATFSVLLPIAE